MDGGRYSSSKYAPPSGRRSPIKNMARLSMPAGVGYAPFYSDDMPVLAPSRGDGYDAAPRGQSADYGPSSSRTTTHYAVTQDPLSRSSSVREVGRGGRERASTIDSASGVIISTTTADRHGGSASGSHAHQHQPHQHQSHQQSHQHQHQHQHLSLLPPPTSPSREAYRDDDVYYSQPATSMRTRGNRASYGGGGGIHSSTLDNERFLPLRSRPDSTMLSRADSQPSRTRPASVYPSLPRHSVASVDYVEDGYEYTNPSDLALYDLDHERPPPQRRHRDSIDRTYYRPSVSVTTVEPVRRPGGPPPTTRGLEKLSGRGAGAPGGGGSTASYDSAPVRVALPPSAPLPPLSADPARRSGLLEAPNSPTDLRRSSSRQRPVSLYQEAQQPAPRRVAQPDDYYRSREDDLVQREVLDHHERDYRAPEGPVAQRGFGLRTEAPPKDVDYRRDRRDSRRDYDTREPRRRSDEEPLPPERAVKEEREYRDRKPARDGGSRRSPDIDAPRDRKAGAKDRDRDTGRRGSDDDGAEPRTSRDTGHREDDFRERRGVAVAGAGRDSERKDDERERRSIRDKVASGLGAAAASIGLGSALKSARDKDKAAKEDNEERGSPRRRKEPSDVDRPQDASDLDPPPRKDSRDEQQQQPSS